VITRRVKTAHAPFLNSFSQFSRSEDEKFFRICS
jgi:hypothetical protein